ncbi:MAG TPA: SDR family NAD(P)-dependent oxidoreductase, partial [Bacteroidia bacterium]
MNTQTMLKENSLNDKIIIVTGGGTGLGKAMAKCFLQLGAKVAITSRKEDNLKKTAEEFIAEIPSAKGNIITVKCDVRNYE